MFYYYYHISNASPLNARGENASKLIKQ